MSSASKTELSSPAYFNITMYRNRRSIVEYYYILQAIWWFIAEAVHVYIEASGRPAKSIPSVANLALALTYRLDAAAAGLAETLGREAGKLPIDGIMSVPVVVTALGQGLAD